MAKYKSFLEFVTEAEIMSILCRERAKYVKKNQKREANDGSNANRATDELWAELKTLMPPRNEWKQPAKYTHIDKGDGYGLKAWTYARKKATARIKNTVKILRYKTPCEDKPEWMINLDSFIDNLLDEIASGENIKMDAPLIIAKEKSVDKDSKTVTCRPICLYRSLHDKVLITLVQKYILDQFDELFGTHNLFMRKRRFIRDEKGNDRIPNYLDAIEMISEYRRQQPSNQNIYVGECDIQKFYDIFNHDVILECFDKLFEEKRRKSNCPKADYSVIRSIIKAYLESFSYTGNIMSFNEEQDNAIWTHLRSQYPGYRYEFGWVKDSSFTSPSTGCYTEEELSEAKAFGKLGIPQGGALSGIIVNVVMHSIDSVLLGDKTDKNRLFVRYCDDIILMHTDKNECTRLLETYEALLKSHKLVPHAFTDVHTCKCGYVEGQIEDKTPSPNARKNSKKFWHEKSKRTFLWGMGEGDASEWIAFVGYEMSRSGSVRIRKDKVSDEMKKIARTYYTVIKTSKTSMEDKEQAFKRFDEASRRLKNFKPVTNDRNTLEQTRRLDKYLFRKARKAAKRLGFDDPKEAAKAVATYSLELKSR